MPKIIKHTVTLAPELAEFVEKKVKRLAKETGEPVNICQYYRGLIRRDREEMKASQQTAGRLLSHA